MIEFKRILDIYQNILKGNYTLNVIKNNIVIPNKVDAKKLLIYYVNYVWYQRINDPYFEELTDFVCIPNVALIIETFDDFINIIHYVKYNIINEEITLTETKEVVKEIIEEIIDENIISPHQIDEKNDIIYYT